MKEPYGFKLHLDQRILRDVIQQKEKHMEAYSAVLIAMIENLDYVEWEYQVGESSSFKDAFRFENKN